MTPPTVQAVAEPAAARRRESWTAPATLAGLGAGAVGVLAVVDPNDPGVYPVCPSLSLFGVLCPLCGGLRGVHALTEGDLAGMVSSNVFVPLVVVLGVWAWLSWTLAVVGRSRVPPPVLGRRTWVAIGALAVLYTVLRNLTGTPFEILAP